MLFVLSEEIRAARRDKVSQGGQAPSLFWLILATTVEETLIFAVCGTILTGGLIISIFPM